MDFDAIDTPGAGALGPDELGSLMVRYSITMGQVCMQWARVLDLSSASEQLALAQLYLESPLSASELARRTLISRSAMTIMVRRLAERGYVTVRPDFEDRRQILIELTDHPARILGAAIKELGAGIMHSIPPATEEQAAFSRALFNTIIASFIGHSTTLAGLTEYERARLRDIHEGPALH